MVLLLEKPQSNLIPPPPSTNPNAATLLRTLLSSPSPKQIAANTSTSLSPNPGFAGPVTDGTAVLLAPGFGEGGWRLDAAEMYDSFYVVVF